MKNKLTSIVTFLLVLFCLFSAFFDTPEDGGESLYDTMTISTEATTEATEETAPPETDASAETAAGNKLAVVAPVDPAVILDAAYALEEGQTLSDGPHSLTGTVTQIIDRYSEKYQNITVEIAVPGHESRPIQCYRLTGNDCQHLTPGDTITVTGYLQNYNGTIEFGEDCMLGHVEWGSHVKPGGGFSSSDPSAASDSKEAVAAYIHANGCLPDFYMTKSEAEAAYGWEGGPLDKLAPGMAIGGDRFTNYQKVLPTAAGRTYTECDIDTIGADARGAKRIVFSNDGLIYYTDDHYETFELLYGEP